MERPATPAGPIGLILPTFPQGTRQPDGWARDGTDTLAELTATCRAAERLGAGALWACDHLFWHGPTLECLTSLTLAAASTERVSIGSCILQLPLRDPAVVAKQVATTQTLSGGRFILGVGVGSHPEEYAQANVDYHRRGRALDEGITELRRTWSSARESSPGAETGGSGLGAARPAYRQLPEPPPVPVWVGGSSEAARRRAARLGDGWMPLFVDTVRYRHDLERLADDAAAAGRADQVTPAMVLFVSVDDDPGIALRRGTRWMSSMYAIPAKAFERHLVSGTVDEVADVIASYREAGAAHVALYVTDDHPLSQFEQLVGALAASGVGARR
ncbi:MAG TPA: LLM class flavin-dependent oxidoreductase [Acidimicrobiales bacterium]|nr:LLM class flavin-dependent oxidoreductase [Acidimicrobiales bacterium]